MSHDTSPSERKQAARSTALSPAPRAGSPIGAPRESLPAALTASSSSRQRRRPERCWPGLQVPHLPRGRSLSCPGSGLPRERCRWPQDRGLCPSLRPAPRAGFTTEQATGHLRDPNVELRFGVRPAGMEQIKRNKILYHGRQHWLVERTIYLHY